MNKLIILISVFFCFSCSIGETDKKIDIHESEELNLKKNKSANDTINSGDSISH